MVPATHIHVHCIRVLMHYWHTGHELTYDIVIPATHVYVHCIRVLMIYWHTGHELTYDIVVLATHAHVYIHMNTNIFLSFFNIVSNISQRDHGIDKIFEHCCLISMVRRAPYLLGTWPVAMVGSMVNKSVGLGNFESYGSLWRFVRIGDTNTNSNSVRVVLECSVSVVSLYILPVILLSYFVGVIQEIGEKPLYLTNNLELTENNST